MHRNLLLPTFGAVLVLSVGCSDRITKEDHRQDLLEALESRQRAVAEGDVERIFSFWTDDVVIYPVAETPVSGIAAVREYVRRTRQELGLRPRISPLEVVASESGDLGYIVRDELDCNIAVGELPAGAWGRFLGKDPLEVVVYFGPPGKQLSHGVDSRPIGVHIRRQGVYISSVPCRDIAVDLGTNLRLVLRGPLC